jgi:hypothetical protein
LRSSQPLLHFRNRAKIDNLIFPNENIITPVQHVGQPVKAVEKSTNVVLPDNCVDQIQGASSVQKEDKRKRREQVIAHIPTKVVDLCIK